MDAEFIDDGHTIDLISIAMVAEDGREYYAQSVEFNHRNASPWVRENVFPGLLSCPYQRDTHLVTTPYSLEVALQLHGPRGANLSRGQCTSEQRKSDPGNFLIESISERDCPWRNRVQIANELVNFCNPEQYGKPEFWTYYGSYDHVALAQLYGPMIGLPPGWPMYTMDIKQWCVQLGDPQLPEQTSAMEHNALNDARWNKVAWEFLRDLEATRPAGNQDLAKKILYAMEISEKFLPPELPDAPGINVVQSLMNSIANLCNQQVGTARTQHNK